MEAIKVRMRVLERVANRSTSLGDPRHDWEMVALQLRMVLELIAFSSLCATRDAYAAVHSNFREHWNAKRLLQEIGSLHPGFYPQPVRFTSSQQGKVKFAALLDGFLTEDEFVQLYDACSKTIHTANPFGDLEQIDFVRELPDWITRIRALLDAHIVRPHGIQEIWLAQMAAGEGGTVHLVVAGPTAA